MIRPDGKKWVKFYENICEAICAADYDAILDFLDKGVDLNKSYMCGCSNSNYGMSPFQLLIWKRQSYMYEILDQFIKKGLDLRKINPDMIQIYDIKYNIIKLMLDNGYEVNAKGSHGNTLLYELVTHLNLSDSMLENIKLLFEYKADATIVNEYLMSPLHGLSCFPNNVFAVPCAQLLLDHRVDVTLKNVDGMTALDYAKREKAAKEFQSLLKKAEKMKR